MQLYVIPGRAFSVTCRFLLFSGLVLLFSCQARRAGTTYWFVRSGSWDAAPCWRDNLAPGDNLLASDTVHILSNAQAIVNDQPLRIDGVVIVDGGWVLGKGTTIDSGGAVQAHEHAQIDVSADVAVYGTMVLDTGTRYRVAAGITFTALGGLIHNYGDFEVDGQLQNQGSLISERAGMIHLRLGSFVSTGKWVNMGTITNDHIVNVQGGTLDNQGAMACTQQSSFLITSGHVTNSPTGKLRLLDQSTLTIQSGSTLQNDDTIYSDPGARIVNQGTVFDEQFIQSRGTLVNQGRFGIGAGATQRSAVSGVGFLFSDTVLNTGTFTAGTNLVTGTGTFISYFTATLQGYTSGPYIYKIVSNVVDEYCVGPCQVPFSLNATGNGIIYQWQVSTNNGGSWANVQPSSVYSGTTSRTLTVSMPPDGYNGYQYRCSLTGPQPNNTTNSAVGTLYLHPPPAKK